MEFMDGWIEESLDVSVFRTLKVWFFGSLVQTSIMGVISSSVYMRQLNQGQSMVLSFSLHFGWFKET